MVTNPVLNAYKCKNIMARYLVIECGIPFIHYDNTYFYFQKSKQLERAFKKMPLILKIFNLFVKH